MSATDAKPTQAESSGTLTAEKVRELMEENSRQYPSPTDPYVWLTEYDWQAIAATLGSCNCSNDCANGERMDVPRLPHFWTHDGALHVELPKLPESISVRLPAQHDREVRSARVWQYTRDNGTCHITDNGPWGYPYVCSACGASFDPDVNGGEFNYCPNCRRRIEVDDG